jgi:lysophospholipase L1-like esterase
VPPARPASRTLLALGDSITAERGSWAERLAAALALTPVVLAETGATAAGVVAGQLPRAGGPHALVAVYVGVNDARALNWDAGAYARALEQILAAAARAAPTTLVLTLPRDLGRPPAGDKPAEASTLVRAAAGTHEATVVELGDFGGPRHVWPDHVHPTPAGQHEIALRALGALRPAGWSAVHDLPEPTGGAAFAARYARELGRDLARRRRERRALLRS